MRPYPTWCRIAACLALSLAGCDDGGSQDSPEADSAAGGAGGLADVGTPDAAPPRDGAPPNDGIYGFVHGCYTVEGYDGASVQMIQSADGGYAFGEGDDAVKFRLQPSDLATYLLYDTEGRYLVAEENDGAWRFTAPSELDSKISLLDDSFESPAEWVMQVSSKDPNRFQLQHKASGQYLALDGLAEEADASVIAFFPAEGCAAFPELTIDAEGMPGPREWPDGDLYGIAEVHSHMFTNVAFGGSNMFHGAPFHPLGVEHALPDCAPYHGNEGRKDLVGLAFDGGLDSFDVASLLPILTAGETNEFNHFTDGYPTFSEWPNAWKRSTHQTMYYKWLERAWRGGLRLVFQHVTGNSVLCEFGIGLGTQVGRYGCNDMLTTDRSIEAIRQLERYIDAQSGGPGQGWMRIVTSPAEARQVINEGKLAIVLGIEISNVFDCFLTPPEGFERCTADSVRASLDRYYDQGVRIVFPVHKFDNGFGPGDGMDGVIEMGNFINTGHYTSKTENCPLGMQSFDQGGLTFSELNQPRNDYLDPPVVDMSGFAEDPIATLTPHLSGLLSGPAEGNYCQTATLTELGETLLDEMMRRGMLADIAHLPQRSLQRTLEILEEKSYPALSTHGNTHDGALMRQGGMTQINMRGCADVDGPGRIISNITTRSAERVDAGAHPGTALGFDLNGFAGARRPRFGEQSNCPQPQANPVEYPFTSHDGTVEFQRPQLADREVDFNTEGFLHIGLLPELIEDARLDGATDEDLEPLFRSAEAVVRMWEIAEERAAAMQGQ
ncbi:MAG: hypothetical protein ACE366_13780 [Bradymonadia bacterium]